MKLQSIGMVTFLFLSIIFIFPLQLPAALNWYVKLSMPTARYDMATGTVNNVIYVIGGGPGFVPVATVEAYNPTADTVGGTPWTTKSDMPYNMHRLAAAVINDTIYTCGGWYGMGVKAYTLEYDPLSDIWIQKTNMPAVRQYHTAASAAGKMYAIGGAGPVNTCFEYDPVLDSWDTKTAMPTARYGLAAATVGGKIYVIGGHGASGVLATVEEYDPSTDTWTAKTPMPTPRRFLTVCVKLDTLYAIGGIDDSKAYHNTVEKYVPVTDTWFSETAMPTARRAPISSVVNGIIYVIGGDNGSALDTNEAAEPATAIELTSFNAVGEKGGVLLSWSTSLETGIACWIIQRYTTGTSCETIATLNAKLESPTPSSYRHFDAGAQPIIQNYYRLGAQCVDNSTRWYGPVSATPLTCSDITTQISPNPFTTSTTIHLAGLEQRAERIELEIFDAAGRLVKNFILYPSPFILPAKLEWNAKDNYGGEVSPGIYFVRIKTDNFVSTKMITLIH